MSYLHEHGFDVMVIMTDDMAAIKDEHFIPQAVQSCHTTIFEDRGYVVEGHIPVAAIDQLLEDSPDVDGIALPGMPAGTPGMPGQLEGPLEIFAIKDGQSSPYLTLDVGAAEE